MPIFGGPGITPTSGGNASSSIALAAGGTYLVPSGWYGIRAGTYTTVQEFDPTSGVWRQCGGSGLSAASIDYFHSDGVNLRLANQSGCVVGAVVTTAGSGYTIPPTITLSAGGAVCQAVLGQYVSSYAVTNGGANYIYPPLVWIAPPPNPGIPATAIATISGGAVTAITVIDAGAGYTSPPLVALVNDPRDTTGYGASGIATLAGLGGLTAILVTNHGNPVTGTGNPTRPTVTITALDSGSGAVAVSLMDWAITAYTVPSGTSGAGYVAPLLITGGRGVPTASVGPNPTWDAGYVRQRQAVITGALSSGAITATGQVVLDGGSYHATPTAAISANGGPTTAGTIQFSMGGFTDVSFIYGAA